MPRRLSALLILFLTRSQRAVEAGGLPLLAEPRGSLRHFGRAHYDDSLPTTTWEDLSREGSLSVVCDASAPPEEQCGAELVCRKGVCSHCADDGECPVRHSCQRRWAAKNVCRPLQQMAWRQVVSDPKEFLCTILVFFAAMLAATAGTGGGGIYVPLLIMLSSVKADAAIQVSQCMVLCGSVVNLSFFVCQRHPVSLEKAKVDFDCVARLQPLLMLGVTVGVLVHRISPKWLLLALLGCTLGLACWRSTIKGLRQFREESAESKTSPRAARPLPSFWHAVENGLQVAKEQVRRHRRQLCSIFAVWLFMVLASFHGLNACTGKFVGFFSVLATVLVATTIAVERYVCPSMLAPLALGGRPGGVPPARRGAGEGAWLPLVGLGAGLLGGMLGLGGGIIVGPCLLEIGMHSEAVQASTAAIVFMSSSLATIQYVNHLTPIWDYMLWYSVVVVAATFLGQYLAEIVVRTRKRYSAITLSIAAILFASLLALTFVGVSVIRSDFELGRQIRFSTSRLCRSLSPTLPRPIVVRRPEEALPKGFGAR